MSHEDQRDWSWLHDDADTTPAPKPTVTVVLVTKNAQDWLPTTLTSLERGSLSANRIVVVDNGSTDETLEILHIAQERRAIDAIYNGDARWGYGQAVFAALDEEDRVGQPRTEFLWLLTDDVILEPDCLDQLLDYAGRDEAVNVVGPTLMQGSRRGGTRQIRELGVSMSRSGHRFQLVPTGELEQGQHDSSTVLAVASCGMLVSRAVWDHLGGFTPHMPVFHAGLEFCWRANLAGYRVRTAPAAKLTHREVDRAGLRQGLGGDPTVMERRDAMTIAAAHWGPLASVGLFFGALLRALGYLLGKAPGRSWDELKAAFSFLGRGKQIRGIRHQVHAVHATSENKQRTAELIPSRFHGLQRAWTSLASRISEAWEESFGSGDQASIDELIGDDFADRSQKRTRSLWLAPTVICLVGLIILVLPAARALLSLGHLVGPQLLPAADTAGEVFRSYTAGIPGDPMASAPPWLGLFAVASVLALGQPEWVVTIILLGSVPLAALSAHAFLRRLVTDQRAQLLGALIYATLPALLGATNRGAIGVIVWILVLPMLGRALVGWARRDSGDVESWRGSFATALVLTVLVAIVPAIWIVAVIAGVLTIARHRTWPQAIRVIVALVIPPLLMINWWGTLATYPGRFLTGIEPTLTSQAAVSTWQLMIGRTPGSGLPPLWVSAAIFGVVWLLCLAGAALRPRVVTPLVIAAVVSFAMAVCVSRFTVPVPSGGQVARPDASYWLALGFACAIGVGALGFDKVASGLMERDFGLPQAGSLAALAGAGLAALLGIVWWVDAGFQGHISREPEGGLPRYLLSQQEDPKAPRTLLISTGTPGEVSFTVVENGGARLGAAERGEAFGGNAEAMQNMRDIVARIVGGAVRQDLAAKLAEMGFNYLAVRDATPDIIAAVSGQDGFTTASGGDRIKIWRVSEGKSRVALKTADGKTGPLAYGGTVEAGDGQQKTIIIAEPKDERWIATVGDKRLQSANSADFRQAFDATGKSGPFTYVLAYSSWWAWLQLGALVVLAVLAAPSLKRLEDRDPELSARRAAGISEGDK